MGAAQYLRPFPYGAVWNVVEALPKFLKDGEESGPVQVCRSDMAKSGPLDRLDQNKSIPNGSVGRT